MARAWRRSWLQPGVFSFHKARKEGNRILKTAVDRAQSPSADMGVVGERARGVEDGPQRFAPDGGPFKETESWRESRI